MTVTMPTASLASTLHRRHFPSLLLLMMACAASTSRTEGAWRAEPPMRNSRSAHAVVSTGTAIYAIAGSGAGMRPVLEVERFDGSAWHAETTLPGEGLNAPAAVELKGRIHVIGGFHGVSNMPSDQVHVYDTATREWTLASPLPEPRGGHAAVVLDGRIHILGGGNSVSTLALHTVYDPASDTWSERAPLPRSKGSPAAVVFEGRIHAIGGRSGASDFGDVDIYDADADAWLPGPPIEPRGTAGAVVYRDAIRLIGGESQAQGRSLASVLRLSAGATAWQEDEPLPTARNYARAVVMGDAVYVVGGSLTAGASHSAAGSDIVERFFLGR
jgi:hypothetical protein